MSWLNVNSTFKKENDHLLIIVNEVSADDLATQGARASAGMLLADFARYRPLLIRQN